MYIIRLLFFFCSIFALVACQTSGAIHQDAGSGPISLSPSVKIAFESFKELEAWGFFAVSTDGQHYGYGGCVSLGACYSDGDMAALRRCRQRSGGVPCKIYADGPNIVWQGIPESGKAFAKTKATVGTGPLSLSARVQRNFELYLDFDSPSAFAVSKDGNYSFGLYCSNPPCNAPGSKQAAVARCAEKTVSRQCFVYAVGRKVVWEGPVSK